MILHGVLFGMIGLMFGIGVGLFAGELIDAPGHREIVALKACESELPRNQHCKIVVTAVPVKEGL